MSFILSGINHGNEGPPHLCLFNIMQFSLLYSEACHVR